MNPSPGLTRRERLKAAYEHFFFAAEPVYKSVYYRVFLAFWTLCFFAPRLPYLGELYGPPVAGRTHFILRALHFPVLPSVLIGFLVLSLGVLLCLFALGYHARRCHLFILLLLGYLYGYDLSTLRGYGSLAFYQWLLIYFMPYDQLWENGKVVSQPRVGLRLVTLQLSSVYLFTMLAKAVGGWGWYDGATLYYVFHGQDFGQFLLSAWIPISWGVAKWLGWLTLVSECFVAWGLWFERTRVLAMLACVGLHLGIGLSMRVSPLFHLLMVGHLPLFISNASWQRFTAKLQKIAGRSAPQSLGGV